jgi:hypothetical protein
MSAEYRYEPTDLEDEVFVSEVPMKLIEEAIESQFMDPLEYRKKDYVQSFITKYEFSEENYLEDDMEMLELSRDDFMRFLEKIFEDNLSVGFPDLEDKSIEDQHELVHLTYRFFIKNIKKNFVNCVINFIEENEEDITQRFEKRKDVTSINFSEEIVDEYDIHVLSNLGQIIDYIFTSLKDANDVDEFLRLCEGDEVCLELSFVQSGYENFDITGNFIEDYINMLDDDFLTEIQSKVRNKILKKYPYRVRRTDIPSEETDDNTDGEETATDAENEEENTESDE